MPKIDLTILKKKTGPLPNWAWALLLALVLYLVYRHSKNNPSTPSALAPDTSGVGSSNAGDLTSNGASNAVNQDAGVAVGPSEGFPDAGITSDFQDFMSQLEKNALAGNLDASQNQDTTAETAIAASAALGLTHIAGAYWWDPDTHKLVKIPGSGGTTKGSGKKKVPNTTKAGGKKKKIKPKPHSVKKLKSAPKLVKKKVTPKPAPHQVPLTASQRRAIDARHHP